MLTATQTVILTSFAVWSAVGGAAAIVMVEEGYKTPVLWKAWLAAFLVGPAMWLCILSYFLYAVAFRTYDNLTRWWMTSKLRRELRLRFSKED